MKQSLIDKYGNPSTPEGKLDRDWYKANIKLFVLPFTMIASWAPYDPVRRIEAHKLAGDKIVSALSRVASYKGLDYLKEHKLDRWGGCFNFRPIRGGTELSMHSLGIAVDINPDIGRLGSKEDAAAYPRFIIDAFKSEGFTWGGEGWTRPDAMHFELGD